MIKEDRVEDLNLQVDERIIADGMGRDGMDWNRLAQDGVQWLALVNTVMNLRVP
jgi:hypothetical protein